MTKLLSVFLIFLLSNLCYSQLNFIEDEAPQGNKFLEKKNVEDILKWLLRVSHLDLKTEQEPHLEKDVIDYVMSLNRSELIEVAYSLERYHRIVFNQTQLMGGLHDYVFKISEDQIRNFVFKELVEHPEISKKPLIENLVLSSKTQIEELKKYDRDFIIGGGIHDYLITLDRPMMNKLALALENYHRKQRDEFMFGGLHDYINQISEEDLRSYISKEANEHNEINNVSALKELVENK